MPPVSRPVHSSTRRRPIAAAAPAKNSALATTGGSSAMSFQKRIISSGERPAAMSAALMAPADVPDSTTGPAAKRRSARSRS
jgi:hypothetical protein